MRLFRGRQAASETAEASWPVAPFSVRRLYPLPTEALLGITGERHHAREVRETLKAGLHVPPAGLDDYQRRIASEESSEVVWFVAELIPEPDNPYDRNAIAVMSPQGCVGYIDREHASEYKDTFDRLRAENYEGAFVPAFGRPREQQIVLCLRFADACEKHLHGEFVYRRAWEALRAGEDAHAVAERFGYSGTGGLRNAVRHWAKEVGLADPEVAYREDLERRATAET